MIYNSNEIQAIIPHRFPFLYVDGIEEIDQEKKTIKGIKNVSVNEYPFLGHFPQKHVFPGVLIVEALAQTGCVLLMTDPQNQGKIGYLAGINHMRFYRQVIPGDQLVMKAHIVNIVKKNFGKLHADTYVEDKLAATADFIFALKKPENGAF